MWSGLKAGELEQVASVQLCYFGTTKDVIGFRSKGMRKIEAEDLPNTELLENVGKSFLVCT